MITLFLRLYSEIRQIWPYAVPHITQPPVYSHNSSPTCFIEFAQNEMKKSKNYVFSATSLQIFVVTNACNMDCVYCQANNGLKKPKDFMSIDIAEKAVNLALSSPSANMTFEFQGGEPLLNFPVIKHTVISLLILTRAEELI